MVSNQGTESRVLPVWSQKKEDGATEERDEGNCQDKQKVLEEDQKKQKDFPEVLENLERKRQTGIPKSRNLQKICYPKDLLAEEKWFTSHPRQLSSDSEMLLLPICWLESSGHSW